MFVRKKHLENLFLKIIHKVFLNLKTIDMYIICYEIHKNTKNPQI